MGAAASTKYFYDESTKLTSTFWNDSEKITYLWQQIDSENCRFVTLDGIRTHLKNLPGFEKCDDDVACMRAYKATCVGTGTHNDSWVEVDEFHILLRNIFYFQKFCNLFQPEILKMTGKSARRVTEEEFQRICKENLQMDIPHSEVVSIFSQIAGYQEKSVSFNDLAKFCINCICPISTVACVNVEKLSGGNFRNSPPRILRRQRSINSIGVSLQEFQKREKTFSPGQVGVYYSFQFQIYFSIIFFTMKIYT